VQYRKVGEPQFISTDPRINEDFEEIGGLEADSPYEFRVVSVDGKAETVSAVKLIETNGGGI
jgi:hypothetical protein